MQQTPKYALARSDNLLDCTDITTAARTREPDQEHFMLKIQCLYSIYFFRDCQMMQEREGLFYFSTL